MRACVCDVYAHSHALMSPFESIFDVCVEIVFGLTILLWQLISRKGSLFQKLPTFLLDMFRFSFNYVYISQLVVSSCFKVRLC